jgi:malonyl-CoA/methylmalonyl-CoA synthetase
MNFCAVSSPRESRAVTRAVVACLMEEVDLSGVRAAQRDRVAAFKIPKRVLVMEDLPWNAMGKVQKAELRRTFGGLFRLEGRTRPRWKLLMM